MWVVVLLATTCVMGKLMAGVGKVDATLPEGVPLAGYNYWPRASDVWPIPNFQNDYTTWMNGNKGAWEPTWVRALMVETEDAAFCMVTMDAIGADGTLCDLAWAIARSMGFTLPREQVVMGASHSHSEPGAIGSQFLWAVAPATDVLNPVLQRQFATSMAKAMVAAQKSMAPAKMDVGMGMLTGVTHNRRSHISPYVSSGTIDPHLGIIRVDDAATGRPLATVWNYAIHGICYDAPNMKFSGDVMGSVNTWVEKNVGGVSLFFNGDAGDINPIFSVCCNDGPNFSGGPVIGKKVKEVRDSLKPTDAVKMVSASVVVPFGLTQLNLTLAHVDNCTHGGELDICSICRVLDCGDNVHLGPAWLDETLLFTAVAFEINGKRSIATSIPGEALVELGWQIRNDTKDMGFDNTLLFGYSQNHAGYFATANEYVLGGYESLLSFFGINTASMVRSAVKTASLAVSPIPPHASTNILNE